MFMFNMYKADREYFVGIKSHYHEAMQQHETMLIKYAKEQNYDKFIYLEEERH